MKQFYEELVTQTRSLPRVEAVGLAQEVPLVNRFRTTSLLVDGFVMPKEQDVLWIQSNVVDSGYWSALRTPIMRGRSFDARDTSASPLVVVINETMAKRYWPNQEAIGRTMRFESNSGPRVEVIGIAKDGKYSDITESQEPALFIPFSQKNNPWMRATLIVRATGDPTNLAATVRSAATAIDRSVPMFDVRSLASVYEGRIMLEHRLQLQILGALGALALMIAVVGLYGVIAYLTALRTREIGIRMALGADRRRVLALVLRQATGMVGLGLAIGLGAAFFLTPAFASAFNFAARDATVLAGVSFVLTGAALTASSLPARRAAMIHPTIALRDE
jgi:predicted permease